MTGIEPVVSVGDRGKIRVDTKGDLTGNSGLKVYLYTRAAWDAGTTPTKELTGSAPTPSSGVIEADMPADLFAAAGSYVVRAGVTWADGEVLGAPAELQVLRGK